MMMSLPDLEPLTPSATISSFSRGRFSNLKKPREALEAYYHVVRRENLHLQGEPSEWFYFSRCAFAAVEVLSRAPSPAGRLRRDPPDSLKTVPVHGGRAGRRRLEIELEHQLFDGEVNLSLRNRRNTLDSSGIQSKVFAQCEAKLFILVPSIFLLPPMKRCAPP